MSSDMWQFYMEFEVNFNHIQKASHHNELLIADEGEWKTNVELLCISCCPACDALDGQVMDLEQALREQPLPPDNCTRKAGCVCLYVYIAARVENNRLIHRDD
jgi:hypothetical protein